MRCSILCLALLAVLASCSREKAATLAATPSASSAEGLDGAPPIVDASTKDARANHPSKFEIVGATLADTGTFSVVRVLTEDRVIASSSHGLTAYVCVPFFAKPTDDELSFELRAYQTNDGKLVWKAPAENCRSLQASAGGVFALGSHSATFFAKDDGAIAKHAATGADVDEVRALGDHVYAFHRNGVADECDGKTGAVITSVKLPFAPRFYWDRGVVALGSELCGAYVDGISLRAFCMDDDAHLRFSLREPLGGASLPRELEGRWVVAAHENGSKSVVVDLRSGAAAAHLDANVASVVRDEHGDLDGFLVTTPKTQLLDRNGHAQWTSPVTLEEDASAIHRDGRVFVVSYRSPVGGAKLVTLDDKTGALVWQGAMKYPMIGHSIYAAHSRVDLDGDRVIAEGHEAGVDFLEFFAPSDGTALFDLVHKR